MFCFDISDWNWFVQTHIFEIDFTARATESKMEDETDDSQFYCFLQLSLFCAVRQVTVHISM
jgi:hypothetical protein